LKEAADKAAEDTGFRIEIQEAGIRVTYMFDVKGIMYIHENITSWRALGVAMNNPILMAMNDLKHGVDKFVKALPDG